MQRVIELIQSKAQVFPDCAYHLEIIERAELELSESPNICVETCKSLLEGLSKTILLKTRKDYTSERVEGMKFKPLVEAAITDLRDNDDVVEDGFKKSVTDFSSWLGTLRNHRGEISHGRSVPKLRKSTDKLALLCLHTTEAVAYYMLDAYFAICEAEEDQRVAKLATQSEVRTGIPNVNYSDNLDFNNFLDLGYPLPGKVLYSEALFNLYYEDYVIELDEFIGEVEE